MTPGARALTPAQAATAQQVQQALARGDTAQALQQAQALAGQAPRAPDAHQLLAVAAVQAGQPLLAERAFDQALQLAPGQALLLCNRATLLRQNGRAAEALADVQQAAAAQPGLLRAWRLRGELALELDELDEATASWQRCVALAPADAGAWLSLAHTHRRDGKLEAAEAALVKAIELDPRQPEPWLGLGAARRLQGRAEDALRCYARAAELGFTGAELPHAVCGAWVDAGHPDRALRVAEQLVASHPEFVPGHATLADLRWEHGGHAVDPLSELVDAARRQPTNEALWQACAAKLLRGGRATEALAFIEAAPAQHSGLRQIHADALQATGKGERAESVYAELLQQAREAAPNSLLTSAAALMLARGRPADAARLARRATRRQPRDQLAWAYLGTAWRLLGDAQADWLWDVDRLVTQRPVGEDQLPALREALEPLHTAVKAPLHQTLRGGTQTPGMLFGRPEPAIQRLARGLEQAIQDWLPGLRPDPTHPVLSRLQPSTRYVGSWSVRLRRSGHHVHHVHPEGWISSAYHVTLPRSVQAAARGDAGCLVLGVPPAELGLSLPPLRVVRPREGHLVLFPSNLWHGTVPFDDDRPRLSVAFDVQPRA